MNLKDLFTPTVVNLWSVKDRINIAESNYKYNYFLFTNWYSVEIFFFGGGGGG
jgi:hypothetical protein